MKLLGACLVAALAACAGAVKEPDYTARADEAVKRAFEGGDANLVARVTEQDEMQRLCSKYRDVPPAPEAQSVMAGERAAIRYPASGGLMGDWRKGKAIAEDVAGMRFGDAAAKPNGGNCYACHQLEPRDAVYGNIGPSLRAYGVMRGASEAVQRLTYERIYNPKAFTACSTMPRFGHNGVLTPEQISDLVALLLDPRSPVNQ
jgi:L-cysteine S-thiosulfotransferase